MKPPAPTARRSGPMAIAAWLAAGALAGAAPDPLAAQTVAKPVQPPGSPKTSRTRTLELGAKALQSSTPLRAMDIHLHGFHPMKAQPEHQMGAHHFCRQVNEDFAQCVLFDGDGDDANLTGVEYIVSQRLFETLPEGERAYWHPHNGEILSGQLVAPGLPDVAENALMKAKINSYGKTWHFWNTGAPGRAGDALPLGEPMLAWSFSRDGELQPELLKQRDRRLTIDSLDKRANRAPLRALAQPQQGVDDLAGRFARPTTPIQGVVDRRAAAGAAPASAAAAASAASTAR